MAGDRCWSDADRELVAQAIPAFGPDRNLPRLLGWLRELEQQPGLFTTIARREPHA